MSWEDEYLNPPEEEESECKCSECGNNLYAGEVFFDFGDGKLCEDCADNWVNEHRDEVTFDMQEGIY